MRGWRRQIFLVVVMLLCFTQVAQASEHNYVLEKGNRIPIPMAYRPVKVIEYLGEKGGFLNGAEDLFIDKNNRLYVADSQNNRVLKLTLDGEALAVFEGPEEKKLKTPRGVYVDDEGDIYIADTGNQRILHLSSEGGYVEEFNKPESKLLSEDLVFDPNKLYINSTGYIYVIKSQAFLSMDANNGFRGYLGASRVEFDLQRVLIRMFATDEQIKRLPKQLPDSYSNFVIGESGVIYATMINAESGQIKKITTAGKNIYPDKFYGEMKRDGLEITLPNFVDIAVDQKGILTTIDKTSGKIYQYDQEGNLLAAFGGLGNQKGMFKIASSLVTDNEGQIYVLDVEANSIQILEPTNFIKLVHEASTLYNSGNYAQSRKVWEEVLKIDAKYNLAHRGIAKALVKEEKWKEAMDRYKLANDQEGYSEAFIQYRHSIFRQYTIWIALAILAAVIALCYAYKFLRQSSESALKRNMNW